ncbi:MAG: carbohydrate ABC transporter permease [Chloroflexota bacterium]
MTTITSSGTQSSGTQSSGTQSSGTQVRTIGRYKLQHLTQRTLLYLLAALLTVAFFGPYLWSVFSSLKGPTEIYVFPPTILPQDPQWGNYLTVWEQVPFARFYYNTIIITIFSVIGSVLSSTLVAYGFARFEFPGRDILFMIVIATLILPEEVTLVPRFIMFRELKWLDTFLPLTVPNFFGTSAFFIFLLRQFMLTMPRELDEAGEIDGANSLQILLNILLPSLMPALATLAIFSFLFNWNDFIHPLIYLRSTENYTLSLGLRFFQQAAETGGEPQEPYLMAASLMVTLPPILLFIFAQRYFVRGIVLSGIKG